MPIDAKGINVYPSAGPYRIVSREVGRRLVLERNTFYKGNRARQPRPDRLSRSTPTRTRACSRCAPARRTTTPAACRRPPTRTCRRPTASTRRPVPLLRQFADHDELPLAEHDRCGRSARSRTARRSTGRSTGRRCFASPASSPVPARIRSCRRTFVASSEVDLYPLKGANPTRAKRLSGGDTLEPDDPALDDANECRPCPGAPVQPDAGRSRGDPEAAAVCGRDQDGGHKSRAEAGDFDIFLVGWTADYPDPFDFINVLMDGDSIQDANNSNLAYLNNP